MFVADIMLKKLARWLRILGVEVLYPPSVDDDEIIKLAKEKSKTVLTMDEELCQRARKHGVSAFLVPKKRIEEQIAIIVDRFHIKIADFPSKTLCPVCNGELKQTKRKEVEGKVLEAVLKKHDKFWLCKKCGKVFWEGSHWERINESVERIKEILKSKS
jgi:hypothetical protein